MPHHCRRQLGTVVVSLLLMFLLRFVASSPGKVYSFSFPALDDHGLVVSTTSSILSPATFLFDAQLFPEFNSTEGFVLLAQPIQLWGNTSTSTQMVTRREASFNTSFTVHGGSTPVSFVVLLDSFPPLASSSTPASLAGVLNASDSLAFVEVGAVGSYGPESPDVGLNVTITPNGTATASRTVSIQYNAVTHEISVYVSAAAGEPRPLIDALLIDFVSRRTTQSAFVGFFASKVRDVIHGVRNWELTVDRFPVMGPAAGDGEKNDSVSTISSRLLLILLAVLGSVAASIGIASVLVCYALSRRRQELIRMEDAVRKVCPRPATNGVAVGFAGT